MEEESKVPLVRCPNCEIFFPELPDCSVYQCRGCGAVLPAKYMGPASDGLLEKWDEERGGEVSEKGEHVAGGSAPEAQGRRKEHVLQERTVNLMSSSSSTTGSRGDVNDSDGNIGREGMNLRLQGSNRNREVWNSHDKYRESLTTPVNNRTPDMKVKRSELNSSVVNEPEEIGFPVGNGGVSPRSRPNMDQWRNGFGAFPGSVRSIAEQGRFLSFPYPEEGPSNYALGSFQGYGTQNRIGNGLDGSSKVENLEHDRAELLRKLDDLKDQLSKSFDVAEKPKERVPIDGRMTPRPPLPAPNPYGKHDAYMPEDPTSLYHFNMQTFPHHKHDLRSPYFNHGHGPAPFVNTSDMQAFHPPPRNVQNEFLGYENSYLPSVPRRPLHQSPHQYSKQPYHEIFFGQRMEFNQNALAPHPYETFFHQPSCFCFQCYGNNWQTPPKITPSEFNRRTLHNPTNPISYHHLSPATCGPQCFNSRGVNTSQLHLLGQQPRTRSPSDLDSDSGGYSHRRPRKVVIAHGKEQVCHPIACGSPFIMCYNCFELLKLPRKITKMGKDQQKVRCGACSTKIFFRLEGKGLVVSLPSQIKQVSADSQIKQVSADSQIKQVSAEAYDGSGEMLNKNLQISHGCSNVGATNSCSGDYDKFQLTVTEPSFLSRDQRLNFIESEKRQDSLPSCSSFSEEMQATDGMTVRRDITDSAELASKNDVSLELPDSPLHKHPDNSSSKDVIHTNGEGNKSKRNDEVRVILDRSTSRQNSAVDASVATEMVVSFNEYSNSGVSEDSTDVSKEGGRTGINKGTESFFAGLFKKGFRDFTRSRKNAEDGRSNVLVNGQPIPDHVVTKAEKLAGCIRPGNYWYDYQAGFWGVMGWPCLGIIPPFIEEFNYPMPKNCAAGNTGVFINGRELHQKDLDLLVGRGLPSAGAKSYTLDISGRLLDEDTGEELESLGKLAPTVEKAKHGFGMKVPRSLAQ